MSDIPAPARAVVIHVSDSPQDVQRAISTAGSLREAFPGVRVRIIVNGEALTAVASMTPQQLPDDVEVAACSIGLRRRDIDEDSLPEGVEVIAAAPVAIVEEQFNGAAYLRL